MKGNFGEYLLASSVPFAFGRASVLFDATSERGVPVAIKVFRGEPARNRSEFLNELKAQGSLGHPNILPVLDYGVSLGRATDGPFIVLPKCEGGSLRRRIIGRDFSPLSRAVEILRPIAEAMDYAHRHGVIHGDLKPENILFDQNDIPFLADFGVAKYFPVEERLTTTVQALGNDLVLGGAGSTAYMSPEQIEDGVQSPRSDIYSLGTVAFELLTGSMPFDTRVTAYRQMVAKVNGRLVDPRTLNHMLSDPTCNALMSALSVDRRRRPNSALEFVGMLSQQEVEAGELRVASNDEGVPGVFVCYSHKDGRWLEKLETFLAPLVRRDRLTLWSDRKVQAGSEWRIEISHALSSSSVAVLLVSPNFLASEFIVSDELPPLLSAAGQKRAKIAWIGLSACLYRATPIAEFQSLNDPEKPLDGMSTPVLNRELAKIAEKISILWRSSLARPAGR